MFEVKFGENPKVNFALNLKDILNYIWKLALNKIPVKRNHKLIHPKVHELLSLFSEF